MNEIALTPEEIEAIKQPIEGEDGITRYDARTKPHYWIYAQGFEIWIDWGSGEQLDDVTIATITANIKKYCGEDKTIPSLKDGEVDFGMTIWYEYVDFSIAVFTQKTNFRDAIFTKDANFHDVIFRQEADFSNATFAKSAHFSETTFAKCAYFSEAVFMQSVDFSRATFTKYEHFGDTIFIKNAIFVSAKFEEYVPDFRKARFEGYVDFSSDNKSFPKYNPKLFNPNPTATQYSILKSAMKKMEFADKELFFHGKELEAKSHDKDEPKHLRWLYKRYGEFSDYGQSVAQPLKFWCGMIIMFFCLHLSHSQIFNKGSLSHAAYSAVHYSIPFLPTDTVLHNLSFGLNDVCSVKMKQGKIVSRNIWCIASFNVIRFFHIFVRYYLFF